MSSITSNTNITNTRGATHVNNMHLMTSNLAVSFNSKNSKFTSVPLGSSRAPLKGARNTLADFMVGLLPESMPEPMLEPTPEPETKPEPKPRDNTDNVTVVSSQSKTTTRSHVLDSESFKLLEDFVKRVTPDSNTQYSIQGVLKTRHDWAGRVLINENITRSPLRVIAKNTEGFTLLKKRIINAFSKVLGDKVFVSVSVYDVEQVPIQVFLKVRVSRMHERVTEASVAPVTKTEVKPAKVPKAPKVKATQSRFAALAESDSDGE